jgi:alkaline phosphatase D
MATIRGNRVDRDTTKISDAVSRREAIVGSVAALTGLSTAPAEETSDGEPPYNAAGERVGEVTESSAIVHTRLTASPKRNDGGYSFPVWVHNLTQPEMQSLNIPEGMTIANLEGACPGKAGKARLIYGVDQSLAQARTTDWVEIGPEHDFTYQFQLGNLSPDTRYFYAVETAPRRGDKTRRGPVGRFRTAPRANTWSPVRFFLITCQDYACRDHPLGGFRTYEAMNRIGGDFVVSAGDNVYYDLDPPFARSVEIARHHWHRMYSQPLVMELFRNMSGYWLKDDHDSFEDDDWSTRPAYRVQPMTYKTLAPVFTEQVPNSAPDGPAKTLWGKEQKEWLKSTLIGSDATFRVLINSTSVVGPGGEADRVIFRLPGGGGDSHGDRGYGHERLEFLRWVKENKLKNFMVLNGDRHWQYHSIDPETGVPEFCCGAVTDSHSIDFPYFPEFHRFLRTKKGGFLSVSLEGLEERPRLLVRHHNVQGKVVNEVAFTS